MAKRVKKIDIPDVPPIAPAFGPARITTLTSAVALWKRLKVDAFHKWDADAYTEKELAMRSWTDCTERAFDTNPDLFTRRTTEVIDFIREHYPDFKVIRVYDSQIAGGPRRTVICHTDHASALRTNNRRIASATTMTSNAIQDDERLDVNSTTPIVQQFVTQMCDKLPYPDEKKIRLMGDMFVALGTEMRRTALLGNKTKEDVVAESINKVMAWRAQLEDKSKEEEGKDGEGQPDKS